MKGQRTYATSSLQVRESELVSKHLRAGLREVTDIYTPPEDRRKGHADRLLASVCSEADGHGITLLMAVEGSDGASTDDLCGWYKRHGFSFLQIEPVVLVTRLPLIVQRAQGHI
jgi:ribosomal protein S18 acetylase RimI-like enzyme